MSKYSKTYKGYQMPWESGVYNTCFFHLFDGEIAFRLWDGANWHEHRSTKEDALYAPICRKGPNYWRGLAEKPE